MLFSERASKAIQYLSFPFEYPGRFLSLAKKTLTDRPLVRELVGMTLHRAWFESCDFKTVIDVGAYIGAFSFAMATILPETRIYAFDPLPENCQKLCKNMGWFNKFYYFQTALGDQKGSLEFWKSDFVASSSALPMGELHKKTFPHTANLTPLKVPVARLDDYLPQIILKNPALLKVDVQGYEERVFMGALELLRQVDWIMTEISYKPLYEGQATFDKIYGLLKKQGFEFAGNFETLLSPLDDSILQSDAMFVRIK
jgi:FkbM family methyltransferase